MFVLISLFTLHCVLLVALVLMLHCTRVNNDMWSPNSIFVVEVRAK